MSVNFGPGDPVPRVLAVTNMLPTPTHPTAGTFVESQIRSLEELGVEVATLLVDRRRGGMKAYASLPATIERVAAGMTRPYVVHVMYGGVMAFLTTRALTDVPKVVSFCGTDLLGEEAGPLLWRMRGLLGVLCSRRAANRADHIVVKSPQLAAALPNRLSKNRWTVLPNGVDLSRFRPLPKCDCRERLGWEDGRMNFLFSFGEMGGANKRLGLAQAAVEEVNTRGVDAMLRVIRNVPPEEVPIYICASDAVLLTSLHEGSPNVVKEALACNRPVVSVDVGDVSDRISGVEGCQLVGDDPSEVADGLVRASRFGDLRNGREAVRSLSTTRVAESLANIYRLISTRTPQHP